MAYDNNISLSPAKKILDPWYVTGFVDGEGCFCLIINTENKQRKNGLAVYCYWIVDFSIHLRSDDKFILEKIKKFFGAGKLNLVNGKNFIHFNVRERKDITTKILPHFDKYPLRAKKLADYLLWREAVLILEKAKTRKVSAFSGQMLTRDEEKKLYEIREKLAGRLSGKQKEYFLNNRVKLKTGGGHKL